MQKLFQKENTALGKPIVKSDIRSVVQSLPGVISCISVDLVNVSGTVENRQYSEQRKNLQSILDKDIYFIEPYEIFELRFPNNDILVTVE